MIKKVLYINLDSRTDRKERIEKVLRNFSYERITAIQHKIGSIGCSMSHIYAIEYAIKQKWDNVLIMEDDMEWNDFFVNYLKLIELMKKPYDVIVLGGTMV
jgi:glycosyl transferase family 25